ncbi:MAG: protein-glutamate O-methyltransferase [Pseudomonadota bacterium]
MTAAAEALPSIDQLILTEEEFDRVSILADELAGIVLEGHKQQMIQTRLARRVRALDLPDFAAYLDLIEGPHRETELESFINTVTTNLTSFLRENHHFDHLENSVMVGLAESGAKRVRIWSAGCSTGEEPYSIAMTCLSSPHWRSAWDFRILATDLDTNVLGVAARGQYGAERKAAIPAALDRWTQAFETGFEMRPEAKRLITFRRLNLIENWPVSGPFDAIFCRNVLIYFDPQTKARLVDQFAKLLAPDGILYLGHSESLLGKHPLLSREGKTTYRRRP